EYTLLKARLERNCRQLTDGLHRLGLAVLGGLTPIVSVLVGDEADTLSAGHFLFEHGFYVQSVTFPAVPYHAGLLRIQINANHLRPSIDKLLNAFDALKKVFTLPGPDVVRRQAA